MGSCFDHIDAIREALNTVHKKANNANSRWCSPLTSEYKNDMEKRYTRGRSEERYPHYYRGRSLSPVRQIERCSSVEPEVYTYERSTKPIYTQITSSAPVPLRSEMRSELLKPYSDFYYYRPYTDRYYSCIRPYYYNYAYYDPHYYYTPRPYQYSYSYATPYSNYYNYYRPSYHYRPSYYHYSY